jgi:hypothetical protein
MHTLSEGYTVFMALQDYLPVLFTGFGLFWLARMVAQTDKACGQMAYLGWILATVGGLSKATWKLIMAGSEGATNITWLDDSLFFFLGAGFLYMGFALWYMQRKSQEKSLPVLGNIWIIPSLILIVFWGSALYMGISKPDSRTWFFILLGLTTITNFVTGGLAIRQALRQNNKWIAAGFAFNLVAIFLMTGIARVDPQTIPLQWTAQIVNTFSNGAFAIAAFQMYKQHLTMGVAKAEPQLATA